MSGWRGVDEEIYVRLEDVSSPTDAVLSDFWPEALRPHLKGPTAILARQIATPNYEMLWFTRLARRHGLHALIVEHASDWFTVNNPTKLALGSLPIVTGRSRDGQMIMRRQRMLDPSAAEGQRLDEVVFRSGERLIDYHHRKLRDVMGPNTPDVLDLMDLLPSGLGEPSNYYVEFFKMLAGPLVLFEDFVIDDQTAAFFRGTVLPAWQTVVASTQRRPQIVRLGPDRRTSSPMWSAYPASVSDDQSWIRRDLRGVLARGSGATS
jgi:hypothetical protein